MQIILEKIDEDHVRLTSQYGLTYIPFQLNFKTIECSIFALKNVEPLSENTDKIGSLLIV